MNKWYFSKNGSITEAMDLQSAKEFVTANPDSYGWQQSYTQWLPLHCISDFADILPVFKPIAEIPQTVVDEFNHKEQALVNKLEKVNTDITNSEIFAQEFAQEIDVYKQITQNLSPEVKANIRSIEQQYDLLQQRLTDIKQSTHLAANEISKVVTNFNLKVANKSIASLTSPPKTNKTETNKVGAAVNKPVIKIESDEKITIAPDAKCSEPTKITPSDAKIATTRPLRPPGVKVISTRSRKPSGAKVISTNSTKPTQSENTNSKAVVQNEKTAVTNKKVESLPKPEPINTTETTVIQNKPVKRTSTKEHSSNDDIDNLQNKIGSSVKNIFNSMFNAEAPTPAPSMSERLKSLATEEKEVVVVEEAVNITTSEDDEQQKKRKRRRRR